MAARSRSLPSRLLIVLFIPLVCVMVSTGCGGSTGTTPPSDPPPPPPPSGMNVPTWHFDNGRSGLNSSETALTPQNVTSPSFGKLFSYLVDGYVYAQPLLVSSLTMNGG